MKVVCAGLMLSLLCTAAAAAQGQADAAWIKYSNERFGFSLLYPSNVFAVEGRSDAGDGQVFVSKDGEARLLVGALNNPDKQTPSAYRDYIARRSYADYTITYRRGGETWFVLSGEGNGKTFYEKVMFNCGGHLINSFAMIYPSEQRQRFDPIVERIEDSFRPATACEQSVKPGTTESRPRSTKVERSSRKVARFAGPRSAMADRIARERGRDVIVVLRRTAPPYDRRIIRGYVSR